MHQTKSSGGQWDRLSDGSWVWRFKVSAKNALSLDFGLYDFYMPPTAELRFYDYTGDLVKGPFNDQKNKTHKQLWPGPIIGDSATVELRVADKYKNYVSFSIKNINRGFRSIYDDVEVLPKNNQQKFWSDSATDVSEKSGSCNIDVICDEGDDWRDQIRSVARYVINGSGLCTGQMINNAANDGKPLFLTANHCGFNASNAASINLWWNYESNQCRATGSTASGNPISVSTFNDTQSGATFKASYAPSDFALLELDDIPPASYQVYYTGFDRSDVAPLSVVGIHHPSGHAKRISFENNPTAITSYASSSPGDLSHIRVIDWDTGTTEGGSSGSGLWNPEHLLVGQLHGGGAACGNDESDWYGRLNTSWEGGGTSSTRLKDWLDPNNIGVQTLQGLGECSPMTVTINQSSNGESIGIAQNFSASISGGIAPYQYAWDINANGKTDGSDANITATYAQSFVGNVSVAVTDNDGCTSGGSKAVVIQAPKINLLSKGTMTQVCGNNDAFIDPGERWQVPVTLQNNGFVDAQNAYAVFKKSANSSTFNAKAMDNFGNTTGACDRQFIDISTTGSELIIADANPSDSFPAQDEGVATANLNQTFNLYGETISSVYLSTNGYISTDASESGFDFDNDCPLPALPSNSNIQNGVSSQAKIIPLHDDLISQHIFHQHFSSCPRQSELGQDLACDVFMYSDVDAFDSSTVEHFDFEAILYPAVNQWVYQYDGAGFNSISSTIGIQDDNASDGLSFACNEANSISTQTAVCVFHKDNQPGVLDPAFINLETPVMTMGDLQISQQHSGTVDFSIAESASCGSPISLDMQATVYDAGFNQDDSNILTTTLGNNGVCNVVNTCSPNAVNDIIPTNGLWFNPKRSGNGNDMYFLDNDTGLVYIQYTAKEDHSPIWYITGAEGYYQNNQAYNNVTKSTYNGPFLMSTQTFSTVGDSMTTLIDANNAIQTRTLNGHFSAEHITSFVFSNESTPNQRTGLWYNPAESGWGSTIGTQGDKEVVINYLYDDNGQPYWVLGSGNNTAVEDIDMLYFNVFCPHCPSGPSQSVSVGSSRINYDAGNTTATMENMQINVNNGEHDNTWNRSNMPMNLLTPPIDQ